jgi:isopropylmalate/homocitrate/citramalate synthase
MSSNMPPKTTGLRTFVHGEDSTRADWNFEKKFINAVADAGAECYRLLRHCRYRSARNRRTHAARRTRQNQSPKTETSIKAVEIHAHDDFGNAIGNTMAAIRAASGIWDKIYISSTYLGIGERAGNAETEKIMLNLALHYGIKKFEGKTQKMKQTADFIGKATGFVLPLTKP